MKRESDAEFLARLHPERRPRRADRARLAEMMAEAVEEMGDTEAAERLRSDAATIRAGGSLRTRWERV